MRRCSTKQQSAHLLSSVSLSLLLFLPPAYLAVRASPPANASTALSGKVIELQLAAPSYIASTQAVLDFETGVVLQMPTNIWMDGFFNPRPRYDWMKKHGADLKVHSSETSATLTLHLDDGRLGIPGTNVTFDSVGASVVNLELRRVGVFQHLEAPKPEGPTGLLLVFETRERSLGVMQLLEFRARPEPVLKLRYKLVGATERGR